MRNQFDGMKFQVTLKVWRNMNSLTQKEVGELTSIPTSTYAFIENGDRPPTMAEFSHLCLMMGFDAEMFFRTSEKGR